MALDCPDNYSVDLLGMYREKGADSTRMYLIGSFDGLTRVQWSRVIRDPSEATIDISLAQASSSCCSLISQAQPRISELRVHRDGVRVWEGEVVQTIHTAGSPGVRIIARDLVDRLDRTVNTHNLNYTAADDLGDIAADIIRRNLTDNFNDPEDDSLILDGIRVISNPKLYKYRPGALVDTVGSILRKLAQGYGLDFTVVNRSLILWRRQTGRDQTVARISTSDINETVEIVLNGLDAATYAFATTQKEDADKTDPDWPGLTVGDGTIGSRWGRLDALTRVEDPDADAEDLERAAENARWNGMPPPTVIRMPGNASLRPSAPIEINTLIPGIRVDVFVEAPCLSVRQGMRVTDLFVEWTPGGGETVSAGFSTLSDVTSGEVVESLAFPELEGMPVATVFT